MPRRGTAVHVATTRRTYQGKVYQTHLLRRTFREGNRVKHETLGNLSHLPPFVIDIVRRSLKGETFVSADDSFECIRSLPCGHVAAVLGTLYKTELHSMLARMRCRERDLVVAMIVARILEPKSKLATARGLDEETTTSVLGQALGLGPTDADDLYAAMDWLLERQGLVERKLAERHLDNGTLVLYDVTSTYFEGRTCPLAKRGYSRDGKKDKLQIVFGLLCTREGCPVAVEVFSGDTADPKTLGAQIAKIRHRFRLERVVFVGDRGLVTEARIREELRPIDGLSWITALRAPAIQKLAAQGEIAPSLFDERDLAEVLSPSYPGERLIVCRNPLLAAERRRKRQELLAMTERELDQILAATRRTKRALQGAGNIGLRVGKVLNRFKVGKHYRIQIDDRSFTYQRKGERIEQEAALDGIYVIRTDVPGNLLSTDESVSAYKSLSAVERAFRCYKTVDLKVRPIHHHLASRVRAHVFLCMLAYYVEWHMYQALAPALFQDDEPEAADQERRSPVAPARRSASAETKAATKKTPDGLPVHSLRTLLEDVRTIVKNFVRPRGVDQPEAVFEMVTIPTPTQRRAFELLGVPHRV